MEEPIQDRERATTEWMKTWPLWLQRQPNLFTREPLLTVLVHLPLPSKDLVRELPAEYELLAAFAANARDVPLFVLDGQMAMDAVASADHLPFDQLPLPPLPFSRIAVELIGKHAMMPNATGFSEIAGMLITEKAAGANWLIELLCWDIGNEAIRIARYEVQAGGLSRPVDQRFHPEDDWQVLRHHNLVRAPIEGVHLITARSVTHEPLPRPIRRSFERETGEKHPKNCWFIKIGGERGRATGNSRPHGSPTVRFMVRGHWRQIDPSRRTWVRPFIKGPPGAPWRRPRHPVRLVTPTQVG